MMPIGKMTSFKNTFYKRTLDIMTVDKMIAY
jgi:hypothetical protein